MTELHDIVKELTRLPRSSHWRAGQYLMNSLREVRPDLHLRVVGTNCDPYYIDGNVDRFWAKVTELWDK